MTTWAEFYNQIRDPSWPDCEQEDHFVQLPERIQRECCESFGYIPGAFKKQSKLINRVFPINTATACQLKWNWSTIYLTTETTASCHRTANHHFDTDKFDFHNTPSKIQDRHDMLAGNWPERGCEYCQNIEQAGGQSDRITNLNFPGMHAPPELDSDLNAVAVTPRILEVYFDNTCNLKCLYCGPHFSSLWDAENIHHGAGAFNKSKNIESNKQKIFAWLKQHGHNLTVFNILGGEPLYQEELDQCLDLFDKHPAPELKLQVFTNLNAKLSRVQHLVERVKTLVDQNKLREFEITASLDCWGAPQEYVRYPLNLAVWQKNFEYLVEQTWINLIINSTVTPLTVKTLPDLLKKINQWSTSRKIYHYQNAVNSPSYMFIDIFGNVFQEDFALALAIKPKTTPEQAASWRYLQGIANQSAQHSPNISEIKKLFDFLNENDRRRMTHWPTTFPWLVAEFAQYDLKI
jgi:sulfatase maturation enzyme AslB (radical SAM superfamily)